MNPDGYASGCSMLFMGGDWERENCAWLGKKHIRELYLYRYNMNIEKFFAIGIFALSAGVSLAGDRLFGDGSVEISEGIVIDSSADETGAEIGAGIAGGGSEVSGDGASSELPSSAVTISGGTVYGIVMGGSYAKDGATAKITGNSSVNMTSGDILCKNPDDSPYDAVILGGGFAYNDGFKAASAEVYGNSSVTISGGYAYYAVGGAASQDGGAAADTFIRAVPLSQMEIPFSR